MKKAIAISLVILGAVFLTGCNLRSVSQTQRVVPAPAPQATSTSQTKTYTDAQYPFAFSYPSDFTLSSQLTPAQTPGSYSISCDTGASKDNRACLYYIGNQTSDGFEAADLEVRVSTSTTIKECEKTWPTSASGSTTQQKNINGITFYFDQTGGAGLGHGLVTNQYRAYDNGACYTIALNVASGRGQSEQGLSSTFSNMMLAKLQSIIDTFKFTAEKVAVNKDWLTYQNTELGISFQYPATLDKAVEQKDANGKLISVSLAGEAGLPGYIAFRTEEYETLRDCKDVLANGFPGKETDFPSCDVITIDNAPFQILDFQPPISVRSIHFQTKKGVWSFITGDKNLFAVVVNIAKTVKYLK